MYVVVAIVYQGERPYGSLKTVFLDKERNWVDNEETAEHFEKIEDTVGVGFLPPSHRYEDVLDVGLYETGTRWLGTIPGKVHRLVRKR